MTRLPNPGGDDGSWGDILNAFLEVEHNADGGLKKASLITGAQQASEKGQSNGYAPLDSSGKVPSANIPAQGSVPDANSSTKGVIQLTGDLGGTAASPTVPGLAAKANDSTVVHKGDLLINVKDYGAKGDGSVDDSSSIQAAFNAVSSLNPDGLSASGAEVWFPAGTYNIGTTITLSSTSPRVHIHGAGKGATILMRTANVITMDISGTADSDTTTFENATLSDLTFSSSTRGIGTWTQPFLRLYYAQFIHLERVNFLRAGGSAIKAVRYYDGQIENCRFDYCGSTGEPAVHLMCSEQGKNPGDFGYSTDSCNNIYFLNCTWEQNPGTDLHLDGRQSDGTYNASRRMNLCRVIGAKMENHVNSERTDDPRMKIENTSHLGIYDLMISGGGTVSGNVTDWLTLQNTYNTYISHYTAVATEITPQAMRTGLSFKGGTVTTKIGLVAGSVQTTNRPSVALIELTGANTDVGIDKAYYDNNPSSAPLYTGSPTTWIGDQHDQQTIIPAWSSRASIAGTRQLSANTAYLIRFVPRKPMKISQLKYVVTTASTSDDAVDVGIYNSSLSSLLASAGATTGQLNSLGIKTVSLTSSVQLVPDTVYYIAIAGGAVGGTAATVTGIANSGGITTPQEVAGTTPPSVDWTSAASSHPLPNSIGSPNAGIGSAASLWVVMS